MTKREIRQKQTIKQLRRELDRIHHDMSVVTRYSREDALVTIAAIMQKE